MSLNPSNRGSLDLQTESGREENQAANVNYFLREKDAFVISTDPRALDFDVVFDFLAQARW